MSTKKDKFMNDEGETLLIFIIYFFTRKIESSYKMHITMVQLGRRHVVKNFSEVQGSFINECKKIRRKTKLR